MKTIVATYAYQRSDFIPMQRDCLKKYLVEPFEYVVFNNTPDGQSASNVESVCSQNNIRCVRVADRNGSIGSGSHAAALNWSFRNIILPEKCDYLILIDFDMFLMSSFSIESFLADSDMSGVQQSNGVTTYYWPGMLILRISALPNVETIDFSCGVIDGVQIDSGGFISYYVKNNPNIRIKNMVHTCQIASQQHFSDFFVEDISSKYGPDFGFEIYAEKFLHYGRGSNWNNSPQDFVDKKTALLNEIVRRLMAGDNIFKK